MSRLGNPRIFGMRASFVLYLHRRRLRAHPVGELLAGLGIAIGVALVFGVLIANASLTSSAGKLVRSLAGGARFELAARSSQRAMPAAVASAAGRLDGVEVAAAVLRQDVTAIGPRGSEAIQLLGLSPSVEDLGGLGAEELSAGSDLLEGGLGLSSGVAERIGTARGGTVRVAAAGALASARVRVVLGSTTQSLAASPVAVAVLGVAQRIAGARGRVSEVLVKPAKGEAGRVRAELRRLAGSTLALGQADGELRLLEVATAPNRQSTTLFSAIAVMIGFLLALSATLLTVPERRRYVAELRLQGYEARQVALLLGFQALFLGLVGAGVGIGAGYLLSHAFFQRAPDFLSAAFPIGAEEAVSAGAVAIAVACGLVAALLASLAPLLDLGRLGRGREQGDPLRAARARSESISRPTILALGAVGVVAIVVAVAVSLAAASLTILGGVALALAAVCLAPLTLATLVVALPRWLEGVRSASLVVALSELRAITARAAALTAIVALAVFGVVAIGGAREDLLRGIGDATDQYFATAPVWVAAGHDVFNTGSFPAARAARAVASAPGVARVRVYRGGLLDVGARRMWVRARPASDPRLLESSQLLEGVQDAAETAIRGGQAAAVSSKFATERGLRVGSRFVLPTPTGEVWLRVAAVSTNSGWPPGTITIDAADFERWWGSSQAAALEVSLKPGVSAAAGRGSVQRALASVAPGLQAQTASERAGESMASAREGLRTLSEISLMLLIAAALAVAAALAAAIWQRRRRLASLKVHGYGSAQLWGAILIESGVTLIAGGLLGVLLGVGGHALASRYLQLSTGFPAPFALGIGEALLAVGLFCAIALAVLALPGALAARVSPLAALQE
jgi:putative ABC transport system permease protein